MKNNAALCLKLMLSISLIGQSAFATVAKTQLENPATTSSALVAPPEVAASQPLTVIPKTADGEDIYVDMLLQPGVGQNANQKISNGKKHYTIVLAQGNGPQDDDVLITRRVGRFYTFRYCKSHNPAVSQNPVDRIKRLRFSNPDIFQNKKQGDTLESDKVLEILFNSDGCDKSDSSVYALLKIHEVKNHSSDVSLSIPGWKAAIPTFASLVTGGVGAVLYSDANNTLSTLKKLTSTHASYLAGVSAVLLSVGGWYGSKLYLAYKDSNDIDSVANSSYAFIYGKISDHGVDLSTKSTDDQDPVHNAEYVVPSMSEFKQHFDKGIGILLNDGTLKRF